MGASDRIDAWQRRNRPAGFLLGVFYKFFDDMGWYLAGLLTYYTFIALFPTLLLAATALSLLLIGHPEWQHALLESALAHFPVIGDQIKTPKALGGGAASWVVGFIGTTYGALGTAQALQYVVNTIWQVPRNSRPNPFASRARSLLVLATAGLGMLVVTTVSLAVRGAVNVHALGSATIFVLTAAAYCVTAIAALAIASAEKHRVRTLLPGAVIIGIGFEALQTFGAAFVSGTIRHMSSVAGVFAIVLGLLVYLYLSAVIVVFAAEVNAVRRMRLWPRSLLTPFTDAVDLTDADKRAYTGQAQTARTKGYEQIEVVFHPRRRQ